MVSVLVASVLSLASFVVIAPGADASEGPPPVVTDAGSKPIVPAPEPGRLPAAGSVESVPTPDVAASEPRPSVPGAAPVVPVVPVVPVPPSEVDRPAWGDGTADAERATLGGTANSATFGRYPSAWRDAPDPTVIRVGDRYYAYTTNAYLLRVQVLTSFDLLHWTVLGDGLPAVGAWAADTPGMIWAPTVITSGSGYLLYYVAPDRGSGRQCIGTAWSPSPAGPFTSPSPQPIMCEASQGGSIDPSVFEHNGARYLLWKTDGNAIGRPTQLWSERLAPDGRSLTGVKRLLVTSGAAWELGIIEGPSMVYEGGTFVLFYSGGAWWQGTYGIGYATCSGPFGPCVKQTVNAPWERNSTWSLGSGGTEFVRDSLGNLWMAYHGWTGGVGYENGGNRSLFIERVTITGGVPTARNDLQLGGTWAPFGASDGVRSWAPGMIDVSGWAIDADLAAGSPVPLQVHVFLDNRFVAVVETGLSRADVAAAYPGRGAAGFVASMAATPGRHTVCTVVLNVGSGVTDQNLGCHDVDVVAPPFAPVSAVNDDGRLEVFASDAFGGLVHAWQVTAGGAWSGWEPVGQLRPRSAATVARNGDGRLEVFAVNEGGVVVHRWQIPGRGWSDWESMGIAAIGEPAVATNVDGRLELFVRRADGRLVHTWQHPGHGWVPVVDSGASASAAPEINASADGRLEVFVTSGDGGLLHSWQTRINGPFSPWRYTGTFARGAPDSARSPDGRLELFATTPQNAVVHTWQLVPSGPWSGWEPLGLNSLQAPAVGTNADGRLEVFTTDGLGRLLHAWQSPMSPNGWSRWESMGLSATHRATAVANTDGRLAIFVVAGDGRLVQATQIAGVGWSSWRSVVPGLA